MGLHLLGGIWECKSESSHLFKTQHLLIETLPYAKFCAERGESRSTRQTRSPWCLQSSELGALRRGREELSSLLSEG